MESRLFFSFLISLSLHVGLCVIVLLFVSTQSRPLANNVVYSVSLESGDTKGGISQVPKTDKKVPLAAAKKVSEKEQPKQEKQEEKAPTEEKKKEPPKKEVKKEEAEVSLKEKPKETKKEAPKKEAPVAQEKKPEVKSKAPPKPKATPKPKPKVDINKSYQEALQRYLGESTEAGGKGFGSDGRGGKGLGGGIQKSPEWFLYKDKLISYIKSGWNWHGTARDLVAIVRLNISRTGVVSNVSIVHSSGNSLYDESVVRAVWKANPVPPASPDLYDDFKFLEVEFEPDS